MTLADTPRHWPAGPGISTIHAILLFAGIPLLVIIGVSVLVLAPGWVKGPRYRPGQPWDAKSEWFGPQLAGASAGSAGSAGQPGALGQSAPPGAIGSVEGPEAGAPAPEESLDPTTGSARPDSPGPSGTTQPGAAEPGARDPGTGGASAGW